jgi:hypothetical protein
MAHLTSRLTARTVASPTKPGTYADGGGLVLRIKTGGGKFWVMRYSLNHVAREMGLGSVRDVPLKGNYHLDIAVNENCENTTHSMCYENDEYYYPYGSFHCVPCNQLILQCYS